MTTEITLAEAKLHCRVDGTDEDALIQAYIDAALEVCQKHIGKRFDSGLEFTPAIKIGCLMYVSQLYEYRTMISDGGERDSLAISLCGLSIVMWGCTDAVATNAPLH
jgi:uncharacterized phage protein (predicted DNA packaging)